MKGEYINVGERRDKYFEKHFEGCTNKTCLKFKEERKNVAVFFLI